MVGERQWLTNLHGTEIERYKNRSVIYWYLAYFQHTRNVVYLWFGTVPLTVFCV